MTIPSEAQPASSLCWLLQISVPKMRVGDVSIRSFFLLSSHQACGEKSFLGAVSFQVLERISEVASTGISSPAFCISSHQRHTVKLLVHVER